MRRSNSFDSGGSYGPTMIIDRCLSMHKLAAMQEDNDSEGKEREIPIREVPVGLPVTSSSGGLQQMYGTVSNGVVYTEYIQTIRFQVIVWYVGAVDVMQGRVATKFRVTLFWNDDGGGSETEKRMTRMDSSEWLMQGRQKAIEKKLSGEISERSVDVPPLSILNAVSFDIIGKPEVKMLREKTRLMRWTCLYKAVLFQDEANMRVEKFPHDEHDLCLKLGILAHRGNGGRWDQKKWKLALATEEDSQGTIHVPHGLLVDHVKIPEFSHDAKEALEFKFSPLGYGVSEQSDSDRCLEVKMRVYRESNYYDRNIMPMLATLDVVATSFLLIDATSFFQRALMLLNIAFVEIGIRMQLDNHLPNVGYQIKMQTILNQSFFRLLGLELESSIVFYLAHIRGWPIGRVDTIDAVAAIISLTHAFVMLRVYYKDRRPPMQPYHTAKAKQRQGPLTVSHQLIGTPTSPTLRPLIRKSSSLSSHRGRAVC